MSPVISNWYGASPWPSANNWTFVELLLISLSCLCFDTLSFYALPQVMPVHIYHFSLKFRSYDGHVISAHWWIKKEFCTLLGPSIFSSLVTGKMGVSLVTQWQRIHLQMQEKQVQSLIQEDPTCHGATKLMCHSYWACALKPTYRSYWN